MPTQPYYVPLPPALPPQASPPPPWGQVSTHLSTQHLQGQGWGSWAGALGGLPEIGVPLRASPLESFHLQEPTSVQGWERGLCSRWVSMLSRWDAGKAVLGEGLCLSIRLRRSLRRKHGAVSWEGMGRQGHFVPKRGCAPSTGEEKGSRVPQDLR